MFTLKRLSIDDKEEIKAVFVDVFTKEPWCDDWSDKEQLDLYICDLVGQNYSLTYGLLDDGIFERKGKAFLLDQFRGSLQLEDADGVFVFEALLVGITGPVSERSRSLYKQREVFQ